MRVGAGAGWTGGGGGWVCPRPAPPPPAAAPPPPTRPPPPPGRTSAPPPPTAPPPPLRDWRALSKNLPPRGGLPPLHFKEETLSLYHPERTMKRPSRFVILSVLSS